MEVGHDRKDPGHWVRRGLSETCPGTDITLVSDSVELHSAVGKLPLVRCEPDCSEREIWQEEESNDSNHKGNSALKDEQPSPSYDHMLTTIIRIREVTHQRYQQRHPSRGRYQLR